MLETHDTSSQWHNRSYVQASREALVQDCSGIRKHECLNCWCDTFIMLSIHMDLPRVHYYSNTIKLLYNCRVDYKYSIFGSLIFKLCSWFSLTFLSWLCVTVSLLFSADFLFRAWCYGFPESFGWLFVPVGVLRSPNDFMKPYSYGRWVTVTQR